MTRNFLKAREYIVIISIALAMIITGSFVDFQFSKAVYDANNTNLFGIIMSGITEIPTYVAFSASGLLLILSSKNIKTVGQVFSWIIGVGVIAFGLYYTYHTFEKNYVSFAGQLMISKTLIKILAVVVDLLLSGFTGFIIIKKCRNKDRTYMRHIAIAIIVISVLQLAIATGAKFIISRPRPRHIIDGVGVEQQFRNWWEFRPFANLKNAKSTGLDADCWQSCPSGHTGTAVELAFILPLLVLLFDDWKNNHKARLIAFYVGVAWGVLTALSRIYAGAHFLSDVGAGLLITSLVGLLTQLILPLIVKE